MRPSPAALSSGPRGGIAGVAARPGTWWVVTVLAVVATCAVALVVDRGFFYFDDTPGGAVGQWYELGQQLASGRWPVLNLEAWMAGNYLVEQWGLFNPPILLIALASTQAADLAVFASLVKIIFLVIGALGVQALARTVGVPAPWAAVAGISAALAGFTFFMDATTWVTQLMVWAWSGWAYAGLLRWTLRGRGLVLGLVAGYLVITVGYLHGTLFLVLWFVGLLVHGALDRNVAAILRTLAAGVVLGLVAFAVVLPALLTAGVTVRVTGLANTGFMTATLNGLAVAAVPMASPDATGWWGRYATAPLTYVAWFLPLLVLLPFGTLRAHARKLVALLVLGGFAFLLAVGPSDLAMLRFPLRAMPWITLVVVVAATRVLADLTPDLGRPRRLPVVLALVLMGFWVAFSGSPYQARWLFPLCLVVLAATWVTARVALGRPAFGLGRLGLVGVVGLVTIGVAGVQAAVVAQRDPGFGRNGFPASATSVRDVLPEGVGEAVVVGDVWTLAPGSAWADTAAGNLWYLVDHANVMNLYSPSGFKAFNDDLCMDTYYGRTCEDLLARLFARDPSTGVPLADLLSIDTVQVLAQQDRPIATVRALVPPAGWSVAERGDVAVTWVRDVPTPGLAEGAWASAGLRVTALDADDTHVTFRVDQVPPEGGRLVLPRLAWPGYTVRGAALADPVRGYLVTLDVPAGTAPGDVVALEYRPPGWLAEVGALVLALVLAVGLVAAPRRRLPPDLAGEP